MSHLSNHGDLKFPLDGRSIDSLSRDEIIEVLPSAPEISPGTANIVVRISNSLVVKYGASVPVWEARNTVYAGKIPGLRVPKVYDAWELEIITFEDGSPRKKPIVCCYILMQYIPGHLLKDIWADINEQERSGILEQVKEMLNSLHQHKVDKPGPIGGGISYGNYFTLYGAGSFDSADDMEDWFNERLLVCQDFKRANPAMKSFSGEFQKLVFCHMDIQYHNVILDAHNEIWIIDWEHAGGYPLHFEMAQLNGVLDDQLSWNFARGLRATIGWDKHKSSMAKLKAINFALFTGVLLEPKSSGPKKWRGTRASNLIDPS